MVSQTAMNTITAENFMRSAKEPTMIGGVMAANSSMNRKYSSSGMLPCMASGPTPCRNSLSVPPISACRLPPSVKVRL
ncbi:hypothetical protein D9M71_324430 [compost metagenome]